MDSNKTRGQGHADVAYNDPVIQTINLDLGAYPRTVISDSKLVFFSDTMSIMMPKNASKLSSCVERLGFT